MATTGEQVAVANEIKRQIGVACLMEAGAREFQFGANGFGFRVTAAAAPRAHVRVNVTYRPGPDDYEVTMIRFNVGTGIRSIGKPYCEILDQADGIYCDNLADVVRRMVNGRAALNRQRAVKGGTK